MLLLKNKFIICCLFLFASFTSCKDKPIRIPNFPMGYELFLEFTDNNDVNLLNNFDENKFKTDIIIKKKTEKY